MEGTFAGVAPFPRLAKLRSSVRESSRRRVNTRLSKPLEITLRKHQTNESLMEDNDEAADNQDYRCVQCKETLESKVVYDIHMSGHANNMKCAICNMTLKSLKNYEKHCLRCKPYECQICGRVVRFRPNFIKHMRVHKGQQAERHKYKCEVCHKEFMSFEYFKVHKKIHNENVNLTCDVCGKVFSAFASLRGHSKLHSGIKNFKCDVCGKFFGQRYNLKLHSRIHDEHLPYECSVCGKKWDTQSSYQRHVQSHQATESALKLNKHKPIESSSEKILPEKSSTDEKFPISQMNNITAAFIPKNEFDFSVEIPEIIPLQEVKDEFFDDYLDSPSFCHSVEDNLIETNDLSSSLPYSNLFDPDSISQGIPEHIYMNNNDSSDALNLVRNSLDMQTTTDGNFIRKEWVYSNYTVGHKFEDDDYCETASFIYD